MNLKLFEHNKKAYEAAVCLMETEGKAAVIHPTGTGKSFIAFQLALDYPMKAIVWLSPSRYIFETQLENVKKNIEKERNQIFSEKSENTDAFSNITFLTYAKLMHNEEIIEVLKADYIILDEFHRCGATEWGRSVNTLLETYPNAKVLGLSATNVRYLDGQRDMAQEIFDGNIASEITLGEAIIKGILPSPTYVVSMYSYKEELDKWRKRVNTVKNDIRKEENEKILEQLRRALENAEGLDKIFARHMKKNGRYIVFCADKEHMAQMKSLSREWFSLVDKKPKIYEATYDNPLAGKMLEDFQADESEHLKLLFCIDMLNEGIHIPNIDGVILLRPTVSPILYLQQIGRSLSTGGKKTPVIFDVVNNFEALYTIDVLKGEIEEAYFRLPQGERTYTQFHDYFHIYDEIRDCQQLFTQLRSNLCATWEQYYIEAEAYRHSYGNLDIVKSYITPSGLALGTWLMTQRRIRSGKVVGNLSQEQIAMLDKLGMDWECGSDRSFNRGYAALKEYKRKYGDADVTATYITEDGYALGKWVSNLRSRWKRGEYEKPFVNTTERICTHKEATLKNSKCFLYQKDMKNEVQMEKRNNKKLITCQQMEMLNELGMIWDKNEYQWKKNFAEAKKYFEKNRNLHIPKEFITADGVCLKTWINNQKNIYAGKKAGAAPLTEEQIELLESIGIVWRKKTWTII